MLGQPGDHVLEGWLTSLWVQRPMDSNLFSAVLLIVVLICTAKMAVHMRNGFCHAGRTVVKSGVGTAGSPAIRV